MSNPTSDLRLDPSILAAPLYVAGTRIETAKEQSGLAEIVKLASNENPLGPSPQAAAAIQSALSGVFRYPPADAVQLRQKLATTLSRGRGLTSDNFVTGNGASEILDMIVHGFIGRGDEAIICRPTFPLYEVDTRRQGGSPVWADLDANSIYNIDRILSAVTDRTRLIFVCCPNNPSGTTMAPAQADRLMTEAPPGVVIVFDESYREFAQVELPDTLGYVQAGRNVIVVRSFSKIHGLAGLRVGYAIARQEIACYLRRLEQPFHLGDLALRGALAAVDDDEHVQRTRTLVAAEREWLQSRLDGLGLFYIPSQANFVALNPGYAADQVYERMMQKGVIIRPLGFFYMPDFIRVTIGTRAENERFMDALEQTLSELSLSVPAELLVANQPIGQVKV